MTDSELIERVATEVMGWHKRKLEMINPLEDLEWFADGIDTWFTPAMDSQVRNDEIWNPLANDAHMDMVLAKVDASDIICNVTTRDGKAVSECSVLANNDEYYGVSDGHSVAALKRAMLQAIVEAVG